MELRSRLRDIVRPASKPVRELTYEPDHGGYEAGITPVRAGEVLGGRPVQTPFGECLVIDRRYESDRWHGDVRIAECEIGGGESLRVLDPSLTLGTRLRRTVFIDLETTGLSGGAGTVAFLVGCGFFDLGAFQVRQFLLTSYSAERALLAAVAEFFQDADLIVSYNGKTFDVPVMETRWLFHRLELPLEGVSHFDALHAARRLWKTRMSDGALRQGSREAIDSGCRLSTLERALFDVRRVGDVPGFEIPSRYFQFLRSGDPRPLEPVLEHNRLDLVSLAAVTARAARMVDEGADGCPDGAQALALGKVYERAGALDRAEACYRRASTADSCGIEVRAESLYRLGLRCRRDRRFAEAADVWRALIELTDGPSARRTEGAAALRQFAVEALAIHREHRDRDFHAARELALFGLGEEVGDRRRADDYRHRLARLERKIAKGANAQLFWS
jgi:uncharacterized protein YprB with RNaseH-like and TPR domain